MKIVLTIELPEGVTTDDMSSAEVHELFTALTVQLEDTRVNPQHVKMVAVHENGYEEELCSM